MKRWYHIMAHGIGPPKEKGQAYEAEIFNVEDEVLVFDSIIKMRDFLDGINLLMVDTDKMLGRTLPFVILEIQSCSSDKMLSEWITEEWYIYSKKDRVYINIGQAESKDIIDIYNELNGECI
jgi:hypothetical protein